MACQQSGSFIDSADVTGRPTKIVLLGGSVSVGMGSVDRSKSFARLLSKYLESLAPPAVKNVQVRLLYVIE